jgi:hypothetical protein
MFRANPAPPIVDHASVRDKPVSPIAENAAQSDQERIQCRWQLEFLGIYEFEGEFLKMCCRVRRDPNERGFQRADSFELAPEIETFYLKLRRLGHADHR